MSRTPWIPMAVLFAIFLGTSIAVRAIQDSDPDLEPFERGLEQLSERLDEIELSVRSASKKFVMLEAQSTEVTSAVRSFEQKSDEFARVAARLESIAAAAPGTFQQSGNEQSDEQRAEDFIALVDRVLTDEASGEEQEQFWKLAKFGNTMDSVIDELENQVDRSPGDVYARMKLASAYVAKLLTVAVGPERGVWSNKAEAQWKDVAEQDPTHWQSRFNLGNNLSYYPTYLNRSQDAIEWLQKSVDTLDGSPVEERHIQSFTRLSHLHCRVGNAEQARAILVDGLTRHPGSDALRRALQSLEDK